jgi:uncharacterized protein (TIGR03435 family)
VNRGRFLLLAGWMGSLWATSIWAQEGATEPLRFESATVTQVDPGTPQRRGIPPTDPERLSLQGMTLTWLAYTAYEEGMGTQWKVQGGPEWTDTTKFSIEAKAPKPSSTHELRMMLRTLLAERFGLKVREETAEPVVYLLYLDRSDGTLGRNVRDWDGTCVTGQKPTSDDDPYIPRCASGFGGPGLVVDGGTMFVAGDLLSLPPSWGFLGGKMVEDRTGLKGRYSMRLQFKFGPWAQAVRSPNPDETSKELIEAVRDQWGMRIEKGKGVLHVVEIEHAEMPPDN